MAFTTKGKKLYAIALEKPTKSFVIDATKGWANDEVVSVKLLGSEQDVVWKVTANGLAITPPSDLGKTEYAWSFEIETNSNQHTPNAIQTDASKALQGTKKVNLDGNH